MLKLSFSIICLSLFSCVDNNPSYSKRENRSDTVVIEKTILTKAITNEGNFILYSDSTWAVDLEPKKVVKSKKKSKKSVTSPVINPPVNPTSYNSYSAPAPSTYSNNSYSSLCGARTKKGGSCRRKVNGGGRCWQH